MQKEMIPICILKLEDGGAERVHQSKYLSRVQRLILQIDMVNKSKVLLNYFRNIISIESWHVFSSSRHEMNHLE